MATNTESVDLVGDEAATNLARAALFAALVGDTAGYLWSYPIAAALVGGIVHRGLTLRDLDAVRLPTLVGATVVGTLVIYALGVVGLIISLDLALGEAVVQGAAVFLPAEAAKIAAAVGIVRSDAVTAA